MTLVYGGPVSVEQGSQWHGGAQLKFKPAQLNQSATLSFAVSTGGSYDFVSYFTHGPGYGTVQVAIDGVAVGKPIVTTATTDSAGSVASDLGVQNLAAGNHRLTLTVTASGASGSAVGLDDVVLAS